MKSIKLIIWFVTFFMISFNASAKCSGNACQDVSFYFSNGCHYAENSGSQEVKVKMGAVGFTLSPGQSRPLINPFGKGKCLQSYRGGNSANYTTN